MDNIHFYNNQMTIQQAIYLSHYQQMMNPFLNYTQYQFVYPQEFQQQPFGDQENVQNTTKMQKSYINNFYPSEDQIKEEYPLTYAPQQQTNEAALSRYIKRKKTKRKYKKFYNQGTWTQKEHKLYLAYILENKDIILAPDLKRHYQVFKQISRMVKSRTAAQCRSHHQKFDFLNFLNQDQRDKDNS